MAGNTNVAGRSVTSKVMAILEAFLPASRELTLNQLARRTGLPVSTTYRLTVELVEAGAWSGCRRVATGSGCACGRSPRSPAAASRCRRSLPPYMADLYEATHENVQLAVLNGREALYIEKIAGRRSARIRTRRGGRLPLHATGVGKVLLAYARPDIVDEILDSGLRRYTPHTVVAPGQLRRVLADVRASGVAFAREELTPGSVSVAAPVFDASGTVVAAMSLVLKASDTNLRRLAPAVRTAACGVSREMRTRSILIDRGGDPFGASPITVRYRRVTLSVIEFRSRTVRTVLPLGGSAPLGR